MINTQHSNNLKGQSKKYVFRNKKHKRQKSLTYKSTQTLNLVLSILKTPLAEITAQSLHNVHIWIYAVYPILPGRFSETLSDLICSVCELPALGFYSDVL